MGALNKNLANQFLYNVRRILPSVRNWPDRAVLILDEQCSEECMAMHTRDLATYDALKQLRGPTAQAFCVTYVVMYNVQVFHHIQNQAMVKRSIFQSGPSQCLQQVLVENGYTRNDVVIAHVESRALRVGGSQLVEDGVNRQRRSEQTSGNQIMAPERA